MRGCERRVIMLKGTDSEIFDEAYFLLRRDFKNEAQANEIVSEAQRIVSLNTTKKRRKNLCKKDGAAFLFGIAAGIILAVVFNIIF